MITRLIWYWSCAFTSAICLIFEKGHNSKCKKGECNVKSETNGEGEFCAVVKKRKESVRLMFQSNCAVLMFCLEAAYSAYKEWRYTIQMTNDKHAYI